jgi:CheY-like chemotaxis protein
MDVRMPIMDGLEATRRIRADEKLAKLKVVAVTASVFRDSRHQIMAAGFDDMLGKPLRAEELFGQIERHLGVRFVEEAGEGRPEVKPAAPSRGDGRPVSQEPLPPEVSREAAIRISAAVEIGDVTALGALAAELAAQGGSAAALSKDVSRLTRDLDFDGLRRLAQQLNAGSAAALVPSPSTLGEG